MSDLYLSKNVFLSLNPIPSYFNLLDNNSILQYEGIAIGKLQLDNNNAINFEKQIYSPISTIVQKNEKNNDISIIIKNNEKTEKTFNEKDNKSHIAPKEDFFKTDYFLEGLHLKNDKETNDLLFSNFIQPSPPKSFVNIIINNGEKETNDAFSYYKYDINNYKEINNIIAENIPFIKNNNQMQEVNNRLLFNKVINEENNYNYFDNNSKSIQKNFPNFSDNKIIAKRLFTTFLGKSQLKKEKRPKIPKKYQKEVVGNKKVHSAFDDDNILRKIQVHYLSFIISFVNDIISSFTKDKSIPRFKNLDYKIKKTVNHKFVENLKSKNIGDILQLKASPKMKLSGENVNKNIYIKIWEKCPFIHNLLQKNYITFFKEYYLNNSKNFEVEGKIIKISLRTQTFSDLTLKNIKFKEKLRYVAINYFLNRYKRHKKPNFKVHIFKQKKSETNK